MRTCIFQLYAPMISWGEIAIGGERRSALQPSRSAVIGIIAAALGIKRDNEEELARLTNEISIAVRVDQPGRNWDLPVKRLFPIVINGPRSG